MKKKYTEIISRCCDCVNYRPYGCKEMGVPINASDCNVYKEFPNWCPLEEVEE